MTTATATSNPTTTRTFVVDPAHSEVTFQVRHLLTRVRGRFSIFEGEIDYNAPEPERSTVTFVIDAASIDTNEPNRDTHLRSADFFETEKHQKLTFESRKIVRHAEDRFDVHGNLTIHG